MLSADQRRQIYALKGKCSPADCAEKVGCSSKTVRRMWANPKPVVDKPLTHTCDRKKGGQKDKTEGQKCPPIVQEEDPTVIEARNHFCTAEYLRGEMISNLLISKSALQYAVNLLVENPQNTDAIRTISQISKTVQNALEDLAKWTGLDKGEKQKDTSADEIEDTFSEYASEL